MTYEEAILWHEEYLENEEADTDDYKAAQLALEALKKHSETQDIMIAQIKELDKRQMHIHYLEAELDKADADKVALLQDLRGKCSACKHYTSNHNEGLCAKCLYETVRISKESLVDNWEWRGPQQANQCIERLTEDEEKARK